MCIQPDIAVGASEPQQEPNLFLTDAHRVFCLPNKALREAVMQPTLRPAQYLHGLRAKTHFLLELTVHRLLGVLVAVHTALGKLPRVSAIDSATPKHLILCIANHDAHIRPETITVDHAFVVCK